MLAEGRYRTSNGTYDEGGKIYSSLMGLAELKGNTVRVVALDGAYIPKEGDLVIGTIKIVAGNNWKIDIGGPYGASLHANNSSKNNHLPMERAASAHLCGAENGFLYAHRAPIISCRWN
ncbi:MAG: hypothetical protein KAX26_10960 [Anaerolineae bacterium]|nr:hypothetical protein [Anaerolineae bacterium]